MVQPDLSPQGQCMQGPAIDYMCTKFGVDSSSRFSSTAWTDTHKERPTVMRQITLFTNRLDNGVGKYLRTMTPQKRFANNTIIFMSELLFTSNSTSHATVIIGPVSK